MLRLDAVSLSSPPPSPSPSLHVNLHGLLLDSLSCDPSSSSSFTCSPLASLPAGAGMGVVTTLDLRYQHHLKVNLLLTLGTHAQEGYGTCLVCLYVCVSVTTLVSKSFVSSFQVRYVWLLLFDFQLVNFR